MTAHVTITLEFADKSIATLREIVDKPHPRQMREIINLLKGAMLGLEPAYARMQLATARASGTFTGTAAGVAPNDTVTIAGVTLTNKASPANENEFADAATTAALAASLAAAINAHSTLSKIVEAIVTSASTGVVTVYSKIPGVVGNSIALAESGGSTVTGAAMTGGASDEMDEQYLGYSPSTALAG